MRFSVIIPCYNVENYIQTCLDSINDQDFSDWECICVDDGSSDSTGVTLDMYAIKNPRFHVIHKCNEGVSAARNEGVKVAQGEYLIFVDSDDALALNALNALSTIIDQCHPDIIRYGNVKVFEHVKGWRVDAHCTNKVLSTESESGVYEIAQNLIGGLLAWNGCVRRSMVGDLQFRAFPNGEDVLWGTECALRARQVVLTNLSLYSYLQRVGSATKSSMGHVMSSLSVLECIVSVAKTSTRYSKVKDIVLRRFFSMWLMHVSSVVEGLVDQERRSAQMLQIETGRRVLLNSDLLAFPLRLYFAIGLFNIYTFTLLVLQPYAFAVRFRQFIVRQRMNNYNMI